jgi:hypothetical protein
MATRPDLRLLFATDLSEASLRASGALPALAARCRIDVAFVHVTTPGGRPRAYEALHSFVSRVQPPYANRALLLEGSDPVDAITDLCARARFDLVVAPPSERPSFAGIFGASFRARLLRRGQVALWSGGHGGVFARPGNDIATVGCVVDLDDRPARHLRQAWAFARRIGAPLHVVSTVPAIDDATIARVAPSDPPLTAGDVSAWIRQLLPGATLASLEVTVDESRARLHRRMAERHPDVVFVGRQHWASALWPARYPRFLDRLAYPVICLSPARSEPMWSFEEAASWIGAKEGTEALAQAPQRA